MSADTMKHASPQAPQTLEEVIGSNHVTTAAMTALHRCDRCGAQALVRAVLGNAELLFCGHHAKSNVPLMESSGWLFDNQETQLLKN